MGQPKSYPPPKGHCASGRVVVVAGLGWDTAEPKELGTDSAATSYLRAFASQAQGGQRKGIKQLADPI